MPMGVTAAATTICAVLSVACGIGGMVLGQTAEGPWVQGGAFGLACLMIYFWRKDARARESGLGRVIDKHRSEMAALHAQHRQDMKTILAESTAVMKEVIAAIKGCGERQQQQGDKR